MLRRARPAVVLCAIALFEYGLIGNLLLQSSLAAAVEPVVPAGTTVMIRQPTTLGSPEISASNIQTTARTSDLQPSAPATTPQYSCQTTPFTPPTEISLFARANGVTRVIDDPVYYRTTYSDTLANTVKNVAQCAAQQPGTQGFHGSTAYRLNWTYYSTQNDSGVCQLQDVKVGIHITHIYPELVHSNGVSPAVISKWASTYAALVAHEAEHESIDIRAANDLNSQLLALRAPCDQILQSANDITSNSSQNLKTSNDTLDSATDHGTRVSN